jgi:protein-S-isoprenylcysteine O-methyltransferase Ste14
MTISSYFIAFLIAFLLRNVIELIVAPRYVSAKSKVGNGMPSLLLLVMTFAASGAAVLYYLLMSVHVDVLLYVIGIALFIAGYAGRLISLRTIRDAYGLFFEPRGAALVTGGVYAVVRHPIYLFYVIEMLGLLLVRINPISLIALIVNILTCIHRANREEKALLDKFGDDFAAYKRTTRKFLPFIF